MKSEYLDKIMAKIDAFPSIPGSAVKLLELLENDDVPVKEIEDVLRLDPGMTANVLKLTNSAYFGLPTKVGSVKRAVMLLGMNKIKQLVMASCVGAVMDGPIPGYDLPAGELWRHSLAVSVAAEGLSRSAPCTTEGRSVLSLGLRLGLGLGAAADPHAPCGSVRP